MRFMMILPGALELTIPGRFAALWSALFLAQLFL